MSDDTESLAHLLKNPEWATSDPDDPAEVLEAYRKALRLQGFVESMQLANSDIKQQTPDGYRDRVRRAWVSLRGGDPSTGADRGELAELSRLATEVEDVIEDRADDLEDRLADRLDTDDVRGFH